MPKSMVLQQKKKSKKLTKINGHGDYSSSARKAKNTAMDIAKILGPTLKNALIKGGSALGGVGAGMLTDNPLAARTGSKMGALLGAKLSKIIGSGDYMSNDTMANSLIGAKGDAYASFKNDGTRSIRIKHREYLQDIVSPGLAFSLESYPINPGLPFSFPYLANIAQNFEEYRIRGLVYEYVATATPYSTSQNMGAVIMSMEYNTANPDYTSKSQMENSEFAISAPPYKNLVYGVECDRNAQNAYYVRTNNSSLPGPLTDLGNFFIATNAVSAGTVGELWATYDIEFIRPRAAIARYGFLNFTNVATSSTTVSLTGGSIKVATGVFTNVGVSGNVMTFYDAIIGDKYMLTVSMTGAGAPTIPSQSITNLSTSVNGPFVYTTANTYSNTASANGTAIAYYCYDVTGVNPTITFGSSTFTLGTNAVQVFITDLGNSLTATGAFGV